MFLWERDRGRGLNEMGHSFFCNKSPVRVPTWRTRSGDFIYKANEMTGCWLKMPHEAQGINERRHSYGGFPKLGDFGGPQNKDYSTS